MPQSVSCREGLCRGCIVTCQHQVRKDKVAWPSYAETGLAQNNIDQTPVLSYHQARASEPLPTGNTLVILEN